MGDFPLSIAWQIAQEFFRKFLAKTQYTNRDFMNDTGRQAVVAAAIKEFVQKDNMFKIIPDKPMPSVTPPGLSELGKWLFSAVTSSAGKPVDGWAILERVRSNSVLTQGISIGYGPFWAGGSLNP